MQNSSAKGLALYVSFLPYCSILPSTTRPSKRLYPSVLPAKLVPYLPRVPLFIVLTTLANLQSFKPWSFWLYTTFWPSSGPTVSLSTGFEHPQRAIEFRIQTRRATKL